MASRTIYFSLQAGFDGKTEGAGEKVDFDVTSGDASAFGSNVPKSFSAYINPSRSNGMYADYSSNATVKWSFEFKLNGTWHSIGEYSRAMNQYTSDWNMSGDISSYVAELMQEYPIAEICFRLNDDDRVIASSSTSGYVTIEYDEAQNAYMQWTDNKLNCSMNGDKVHISWNAPYVYGTSGVIEYYLQCDSDSNIVYYGTNTYADVEPPSYGEEHAYYVFASCEGTAGAWSETAYYTAIVDQNTSYSVKCYLNGGWQDCVVKYYNGIDWQYCTVYFYDDGWKLC